MLNDILPFPEGIGMHDWWIGSVALWFYKVEFVDEKLMFYRRHESNLSTNGEKSVNSVSIMVVQRFILLKNLIIVVSRKK